MEIVLKRLHCTIPAELFDEIYRRKDMDNIDNIITMLLCEYYRMDLNNGKRR